MDSGASTEKVVALSRLAERCPGLLQFVRQQCQDGQVLETELVSAGTEWQRADVLAALSALTSVGALSHKRLRPRNVTSYVPMESLARTVDDAVTVAALSPALRRQFDRERPPTLVVSWPSALRELRFNRWRNSRTTLVEMIDEAEQSIVLVFPFIDSIGVQEITPAIERSLKRGVQVVLLTRYLANPESPNAQFAARLLSAPEGVKGFRAINISSADDPRRELLHAKVLVVDRGRRSYVGSANLTGSALSESIEIGIAVEGAAAESIAELVDELLSWGRAV